jgi:hypothetical protein
METLNIPGVFTVRGSVQLVPLPVGVPLVRLPVPLLMLMTEALRPLTLLENVKLRAVVLVVLFGETV